MELRYYPDPVLREPTQPVTVFDEDLADLASRMVDTMHANNGGRSIVVVSSDGHPDNDIVLVNPEITEREGVQIGEEGCLSFPEIFVKIRRFDHIRARYQDVTGQGHEIEADGLLSRAIQHECDHLVGRLLVDRMSQVQRMAHRRRLRELKRRHEHQTAGAQTAD